MATARFSRSHPEGFVRPAGDAYSVGSDAALVRAAQASPRAFAPLYLRYRNAILGYCRCRLVDPGEAEDAASAVFVRALNALPAFEDRGDSFRSWLFRIAHNELADRRRRHARHPDCPMPEAFDGADSGPSLEAMVLARDASARLHALVAGLPARERSVLELRLAGLETGEIAAVLDITTQNVRTVQCRAIGRLRAELIGAGGEGGIDG